MNSVRPTELEANMEHPNLYADLINPNLVVVSIARADIERGYVDETVAALNQLVASWEDGFDLATSQRIRELVINYYEAMIELRFDGPRWDIRSFLMVEL